MVFLFEGGEFVVGAGGAGARGGGHFWGVYVVGCDGGGGWCLEYFFVYGWEGWREGKREVKGER